MTDQVIQSLKSDEGFTVTSTSQTKDQLAEQFNKPVEEPKDGADEPLDGKDDSAAQDQTQAPPDGREGKDSTAHRRSAKHRIETLSAEKKAAEERAAAAEARAARADEIERQAKHYQAELEKLRPKEPKAEPKPAAPTADDPEPKEDDFETYGQYVKAQARWEARQEVKAFQSNSAAEREKELITQHFETLSKDFTARIQERITKGDDFQITPEVHEMLPPGPVKITNDLTNKQALGLFFVSKPWGIDMMKYLSENPNELQRLSTLPRGEFLVEIGSISGRFGAASPTAPARSEISRANPPVRPVTAAPPSASDPDELPDARLSAVEWGRKRELLEERRRKA